MFKHERWGVEINNNLEVTNTMKMINELCVVLVSSEQARVLRGKQFF